MRHGVVGYVYSQQLGQKQLFTERVLDENSQVLKDLAKHFISVNQD